MPLSHLRRPQSARRECKSVVHQYVNREAMHFGRDRVPSLAYGACARIPLTRVVLLPTDTPLASLFIVRMTVLSVRLAHLTRSTLARVHSSSLSFVRGSNTNYFSPSLSLSQTYTSSLTSRHLCLANRALAAFSLAIPAAVSVPLNLSPALALARPHLSPHKHYQSLSRSYRHRSPAQDLLFLAPNSFTTAQQWGLNHTEVSGGGGSRAVVEWRGASKAVGSEGGGGRAAGRQRDGRVREREKE